MADKRVRIGVVGAGTFGLMHFRTFAQLQRQGEVEFAGFAELQTERRNLREQEFGVPGYASLAELIEKGKPEAVTIVTPDHAHKPVALEAAAAGLHVLSEKPLDVTEEGCNEIIEACKAAGTLLQVDFHKRYDPDHQAAQKAIAEGVIGAPLYGSAHMEDTIEVPSEWFPNWAPNSSPAWFLGVHFFDVIRWIIGSEPVSVYATGSKTRLAQDFGIDTFDCVNAKVSFANGCSFAFDLSWVLPKSFEAIVNQGCRIVGTRGMFEIDTQDRGTSSCIEGAGMRTYNNNFFREGADKSGGVWYGGYGVESIADFIGNVAHVKEHGLGSRPHGVWADGFDGLQATRMALGAHESIRTGEVVKL